MHRKHKTNKKRRMRKRTKKTQRGGTTKYIILRLTGRVGLGNILCMYAAAVGVQEKLNMPLLIASDGPSEHSNIDYRYLFKHGKAVDDAEVDTLKKEGYTELVLQKGDGSSEWNTDSISVDRTKHVFIHEQYYQNFPSIRSVIPTLRDEIVPQLEEKYKDEISRSYSSLISEPEKCVFIHIRRGDYVKKHVNGAALGGYEYYRDGLQIVLEKEPEIQNVYILSNDIEWCKNQEWDVAKDRKIEYIGDPDELKALYIMSQCKGGCVLSASSFSGWGAFLGPYLSNGIIVTPLKLINGLTKSVPESDRWIKI